MTIVSDANEDYYRDVLGVKCNPLSDAPLEDFEEMDMFVKTPKYKKLEGSLNQISNGIQLRVGITGSPGFGKTTVLNYANYYASEMKVLGICIDGGTVKDFDYLLNWLIREILNHTDEIDIKTKEDQDEIRSIREEIIRQWGQTTYQDQTKNHTKIGVNKLIDVGKDREKTSSISHIETPSTPFRFLLVNQLKKLIDILIPNYRHSILILVDEAHNFFKEDFSDYVNLFYIKGISFIFSGYGEMTEKCTSLFKKKKDFFTRRIELGVMSQEELEELVEKRFEHYKIREDYKNPFTSGAIKLIGEVCAFNPYEFIYTLIRILEYAEIKRKDRISKAHVKKWLKNDALRKMEGRSEDEDQILRALADFKGDVYLGELISYLKNHPSIMTNIEAKARAAIVSLKKKGCIWTYQERNETGLRLCSSLRYSLLEVNQ